MNLDDVKRSLQLRDRSVRAISKDGLIRVTCVKNTTTVKTAQKNHNLSGIPAIMLGRVLTSASLAASFLKGEERVVIEIEGNKHIRKIFAEAMQLGEVRGFIIYDKNINEIKFENIFELFDDGIFKLSRILYNKSEPIQGIVPIQKGDIATDLAFYYNHSEQIPTSVVLDCITDDNGEIIQSGGLIVQALPGNNFIDLFQIFKKVSEMKPLSDYFSNGLNPNQVLKEILPFEFDIINSTQVDFFCRCSKENFISKLLLLGLKDIVEMQVQNHNELVCHYCNKHYYLTEKDFLSLKEQLIARNN